MLERWLEEALSVSSMEQLLGRRLPAAGGRRKSR